MIDHIRKIAESLGFDSVTQNHRDGVTMRRSSDGLRIFFHHEYNAPENKATVSLTGPEGYSEVIRYDETLPSVGLTVSKYRAAQDIAKRLLPEAEEMHKVLTERLEERANSRADQAATLERLMGTGALEPRSPYDDDGKTRLKRGSPHFGDVEVYYGGERVNISIHSLPAEDAMRVLEVLAAPTTTN